MHSINDCANHDVAYALNYNLHVMLCRLMIMQWLLTGEGWSMTKGLGGHDLTHSSPRTRLVHCSASWAAKSLNWEMLHSVPRRRTPPAIYGSGARWVVPVSVSVSPHLQLSSQASCTASGGMLSRLDQVSAPLHTLTDAPSSISLTDCWEARNTVIENIAVLQWLCYIYERIPRTC